jgi:hypothetical protein
MAGAPVPLIVRSLPCSTADRESKLTGTIQGTTFETKLAVQSVVAVP